MQTQVKNEANTDIQVLSLLLRDELGKTASLILAYLVKHGSATLTDIQQSLRRTYPDIYIAYDKLRRRGLITSIGKLAKNQRGRPPHLITITDTGLNLLRRKIETALQILPNAYYLVSSKGKSLRTTTASQP